jgi:hypothetical protein
MDVWPKIFILLDMLGVGAIKNGQSRDTGNIRCTRHSTKKNKTKNTTQKAKKMSNTDPPKIRG